MANGRSVNANHVMSVMYLRAKPGTQLYILATGPDEAAALESLAAMLHTQESF